jgi:hypothetical protein
MKATLIIFVFGLLNFSFYPTQDLTGPKKSLITPIGFEKYEIGKTVISVIIRDFGNGYEKVEDHTWYYQLVYADIGLSFSYGLGDTVYSIEFYAPFEGVTDKGIILNESTMLDVKKAYKRLDWYISPPFDEWGSMYPRIEFLVKRDNSLPKYPLDEKLHKTKTISRIIVIDNHEDFEN